MCVCGVGGTCHIFFTTEKQALDIMADIQALRDEIGTHEGVKAFLLNVEKMTGEI